MSDFFIDNIDHLIFQNGTSILAGGAHILFHQDRFCLHDHKFDNLSEALHNLFIKAAFHAQGTGHAFNLPWDEMPQVRLPHGNALIPLSEVAAMQARAGMGTIAARMGQETYSL